MLVGVGLGVVVLLLAGALLLSPPAPYDFLRGARFEGITTGRVQVVTTPSSTGATAARTPGAELAYRRFRTTLSAAEVEKSASRELAADRWRGPLAVSFSSHTMWLHTRGPGESVQITPDESGGCYIHLRSPPTITDRVQAWLWSLTHRSQKSAPQRQASPRRSRRDAKYDATQNRTDPGGVAGSPSPFR